MGWNLRQFRRLSSGPYIGILPACPGWWLSYPARTVADSRHNITL